jgi:hypothetical protein
MQLTSLILHAAMRVPELTDYFSDRLAVGSIDVTSGGDTVLSCPDGHGVATGRRVGVAVTEAPVPNAVTGAQALGATVVLALEHEHDVTPGWTRTVRLSGFANGKLNGELEVADVSDARTIVVRPVGGVASVALTGNEVLHERLELDIVGWHAVTATSPTQLAFATPASVQRSYSVADPVVCANVRVWGVLGIEQARLRFARAEGSHQSERSGLFIAPPAQVSLSKDRRAKSGAMAEISPNMDYRQMLLDGFEVMAFCPAAIGQVALADLAHGELLRMALRTFHGLKLPRPELAQGMTFAAVLASHRAVSLDGATYVHSYGFEAPAEIVNDDAVQAFEWPAGALSDERVATAGTTAMRGVTFEIGDDSDAAPLLAAVDV